MRLSGIWSAFRKNSGCMVSGPRSACLICDSYRVAGTRVMHPACFLTVKRTWLMFRLISVGRFLKRIYLTPEMIVIVLIPLCLYLGVAYGFPWMGRWAFGFLLGAMFFNAWCMKMYQDWKEMYRVGMHMADKTTELAGSGLYRELRYATVKMDRKFPRHFWVMIVVDEDSVRMHQGWSFFGGIPAPERIMKSRIYRQVA